MFSKILVPLDESALAEQALALAASIARASRATIDLALVREPLVFGMEPKYSAAMDAGDNYLDKVVAELKSGAGITASHGVLRGDPAEMICHRASDVGADLIVMTSHGRTGLSRAWLGSVADGVMRYSALPVLMLRPRKDGAPKPGASPPIRQILVPLDGSNLATEILPAATKLARCHSASLVLLQVVKPVYQYVVDPGLGAVAMPTIDEVTTRLLVEEAERHLAGLARKLRDEGFANAEWHVTSAPLVADGIADFARSHHAD